MTVEKEILRHFFSERARDRERAHYVRMGWGVHTFSTCPFFSRVYFLKVWK